MAGTVGRDKPDLDIRMSSWYNPDMRTTVRLDEGLLTKAKQAARKRGETLTSLMERGLRLAISGSQKHARPARVPAADLEGHGRCPAGHRFR